MTTLAHQYHPDAHFAVAALDVEVCIKPTPSPAVKSISTTPMVGEPHDFDSPEGHQVPECLARLPQDLDLSKARGKPSGLARLVWVILLFHANDQMFVWPDRRRLVSLTDSDSPAVRKALRLLEQREAITRHDKTGWRIRLAPAHRDNKPIRTRVFWPRARSAAPSDDETLASRALVHALGNRTHAAVVLMLYQFAREPDASAPRPLPPNHAWISRVLSTSVNTVYAARKGAIDRGLAIRGEGGLLLFEDPARWPEILGCLALPPMRRAVVAVPVPRAVTREVAAVGPFEAAAVSSVNGAVNSEPPNPTIISADEAAALVGVHRQTLYDGARAGEIPCRRVGRRYIFVRESLVEWLSNS